MIIINAIGYSKTGKTTLLETITREYILAGKEVAVIKDIHEPEFPADTEGKDTWRYAQVGAHVVVAQGPQGTILRWTQKLPFLEIMGKISADVLVVEGFKEERLPRIVCAKDVDELAILVDDYAYCISGIVSDELKDYNTLPILNCERDLAQIIALAEKNAAWCE